MKFLHISDLHIGKRIGGFSLADDQRYILKKITEIAKEERVGAVLIAGDIYDKSQPSAEAVSMVDDFLSSFNSLGIKVFAISGNHDSAERVSYGRALFAGGGIYLSKPYDGEVNKITFDDEYGKINVYLLPFIKPSDVRNAFADEADEVFDHNSAVDLAIKKLDIDKKERNIILSHQFITGAALAESEEMTVGGIENVSADIFEEFDYCALGHIHRPQNITEKIRYCGTPLKYSFSEAEQDKSATVVELKEKGFLDIKTVPLKPIRDMRVIKGEFEKLMSEQSEDYIAAVLTDEMEIPDAARKLMIRYPNIMKLSYENLTSKNSVFELAPAKKKDELSVFTQFFKNTTGRELSHEQREYLLNKITKLKEGE